MNHIIGIFYSICKLLVPYLEQLNNNEQVLDEVEYDIINYQCRGLSYLPKPKAEADNTDARFDNL